jgi:hypothetical protein
MKQQYKTLQLGVIAGHHSETTQLTAKPILMVTFQS